MISRKNVLPDKGSLPSGMISLQGENNEWFDSILIV
jgi:hypothetical protein